MKRFLTILLTTLALAGLLCVTASASSFDAPAAELSAIGMLKGGANGFDLDKVPTRSSARRRRPRPPTPPGTFSAPSAT